LDSPKHGIICSDCVLEEGTGKVYCLACHNSSGANFPSLINRSSWATHIKSPAHSLAVQQVAEAQKQQAATHQQYNDLYNMPRTFLDTPSLPTDLGLGRRAQFRPILLDEDTNGVSAADFRDIMMEETNYLRAVDEQEDFLAKNTEALRREVENLRLRHLEAEFEGADDETIPQLAQEIRDNGKDLVLLPLICLKRLLRLQKCSVQPARMKTKSTDILGVFQSTMTMHHMATKL
jgi:hypothetical protein